MSSSSLEKTSNPINLFAQPERPFESSITANQLGQMTKIDNVKNNILTTVPLEEDNNANVTSKKRKVTEITNTQEQMQSEYLTEEQVVHEIKKILSNDERIDSILESLEIWDKALQNAKTPAERERAQNEVDRFLDELIVRSGVSFTRLSHEQVQKVREYLKRDVHQLREAMKDKMTLAIVIGSAVISVLGAATGLFPGGALGASPVQLRAWGQMGQSAGQGGSLFAQFQMQSNQGKTVVLQHLKDVDTNAERHLAQQIQTHQNQVDKHLEALRNKKEMEHRAKQNAVGAN